MKSAYIVHSYTGKIHCYMDGDTFYVRGDDLDTRDKKTLTVVDCCDDAVISEDTLVYDLDTIREDEGYSPQFLYTAACLARFNAILDIVSELDSVDTAIDAVNSVDALDAKTKSFIIDVLEQSKEHMLHE